MQQIQDRQRNAQILIVDDDEMFRESLIQNLSDAGFTAQAFDSGSRALSHLAEADAPDMILLDWRMPGMTGIEVLRELRRMKVETPVVFLTVLNDQIYEEAGLHGGAVDFIEKSRSFSILLRRVELIVHGRKGQSGGKAVPEPPNLTVLGHLTLQRDIKRAAWKGLKIDLTLTEFQIVEYLVARAGQDVGYRAIYDIVHGEGFAAGSGEAGFRVNVRSFIKRIRQKFRDADDTFVQIENYPGFGYRWSKSAVL